MTTIKIPMLDLKHEYEHMKAEIDAAIGKCLAHQRWILGPEVKEFEDKVAKYLAVRHCIGVSSGTDALVLALRALAVKTKGQEYFDRSDQIITSPFTFTATGDAILRAGATPVFIDIDLGSFNIDPQKIEEYMTRNPGTEKSRVIGILPVHLYGQPCDMDRIKSIAEKHNLFILEDVAQAFGATWNNKRMGSLGNAGAFSFFPSKNLGAFGDAGMVSTGDDEIAEIVRTLLKHGGKDKYNVEHIGYNARLDTLQAAILGAKLPFLEEFNQRRRSIASIYTSGLAGLDGFVPPSDGRTKDNGMHVYHQYTVRITGGDRDRLQKYLNEKHISTMIYYPYALHCMKVFQPPRSRLGGNLDKAEEAARTVLSLPMEPLMVQSQIEWIIEAVKGFFGRYTPTRPRAS